MEPARLLRPRDAAPHEVHVAVDTAREPVGPGSARTGRPRDDDDEVHEVLRPCGLSRAGADRFQT